MIWIQRPAVGIVTSEASALLELLLGPAMAAPTQRLQLACPEGRRVAAMRLDVISNLGRDDESAGQAELAQRNLLQLLGTLTAPPGRVIEPAT